MGNGRRRPCLHGRGRVVGTGRDRRGAADEVARPGGSERSRDRIVQPLRRGPHTGTARARAAMLEGLGLRDRTGRCRRRACRWLRRERLASGHQDGIHHGGPDLSGNLEDHLHLRPRRHDQGHFRPAQPYRPGR